VSYSASVWDDALEKVDEAQKKGPHAECSVLEDAEVLPTHNDIEVTLVQKLNETLISGRDLATNGGGSNEEVYPSSIGDASFQDMLLHSCDSQVCATTLM